MYSVLERMFGKKIANIYANVIEWFLLFSVAMWNIGSAVKIKIQSKKHKEKTIFLLDTPTYGNMGDQLIYLGEAAWLKEYFKGYRVVEYGHSDFIKPCYILRFFAQIKDQDVIFLQGGGNMGIRYFHAENIRRKVITSVKNNPIFIFQQSIYYGGSEKGKAEQQKTAEIYGRNKNLTVLIREEISLQIAKEMFGASHVRLYPDMATFLLNRWETPNVPKKTDIGFCIRNDSERYFTEEEMEELHSRLMATYTVNRMDTHIGHAVTGEDRVREAKKLIENMAACKTMITDRFHGVVFSILACVPCIVLRSEDHKIIGGMQWFKECPYIYYAESPQDILDIIESALQQGKTERPDFSGYFEDLYREVQKNLEEKK